MIRLSREIRFHLTPERPEVKNSWAGWPVGRQPTPFFVLQCEVIGEPDPATGYLCDIKDLDQLLRKTVTHLLVPRRNEWPSYEAMTESVFGHVTDSWNSEGQVDAITLFASPYHWYRISRDAPEMICLTQQFEFSAAHRLHSPRLSDAENRRHYGKCNNPNGHGHNYVVEVSVAAGGSDRETGLDLFQIQETVNQRVIDRLDHKHLNLDVEAFAEVIPSVENIARVIWNWLDGEFGDGRLTSVRVYETPKTWAEYRG